MMQRFLQHLHVPSGNFSLRGSFDQFLRASVNLVNIVKAIANSPEHKPDMDFDMWLVWLWTIETHWDMLLIVSRSDAVFLMKHQIDQLKDRTNCPHF